MNLEFYCRELESNAAVFSNLAVDVQKNEYEWKQNPEKWSMLEIICHLADEEREDFRARLKLLLESPGTPFPPIDPQGWVKSRAYADQDYTKTLMLFMSERKASLTWLRSLKGPSWENSYVHPKVGPISARFILANWLAHDYLHIKQLIRLKYDFLHHDSGQNLDYAGNWI